MIGWMIRAALAGIVVMVAGEAVERALAALGKPRRWAWLAALLAAALLPFVAHLLPARPDAIAPAAVLGLLGGGSAASSAEPAGTGLGPWLAGAWALATVALIGAMALTLARLRAARRGWLAAELDGAEVLVSRDAGPAVVGLLRPVVVVPAWVLDVGAPERAMVLAHEREHVRARDPWLLAGATVLSALLPWNPAVWWGQRRLRGALEADCDARVLASGLDRNRYADLLLRTAARSGSVGLLSVALLEPRSLLERRLRAMIENLPIRPARAAALAAFALASAVVACEVLSPGRSHSTGPTEVTARPTGTAADTSLAFRIEADGANALLPSKQEGYVTVRDVDGKRIATVTRPDGTVETMKVPDGPMRTSLADALIVVDGKASTMEALKAIAPERIRAVNVLKGDAAAKYTGKADGRAVVLVTTK